MRFSANGINHGMQLVVDNACSVIFFLASLVAEPMQTMKSDSLSEGEGGGWRCVLCTCACTSYTVACLDMYISFKCKNISYWHVSVLKCHVVAPFSRNLAAGEAGNVTIQVTLPSTILHLKGLLPIFYDDHHQLMYVENDQPLRLDGVCSITFSRLNDVYRSFFANARLWSVLRNHHVISSNSKLQMLCTFCRLDSREDKNSWPLGSIRISYGWRDRRTAPKNLHLHCFHKLTHNCHCSFNNTNQHKIWCF